MGNSNITKKHWNYYNLFIFMLFIACWSVIHAQTPYFQDGKRWLVEDRVWIDSEDMGANEYESGFTQYEVVGDTIAKGVYGKKLKLSYSENMGDMSIILECCHPWGYEQDGMIYVDINGTQSSPVCPVCPVLDFSKTAGDVFFGYTDSEDYQSLIVDEYCRYEVLSDRKIELCGIERRLLTLSKQISGCNPITIYWIEGIGVHKPNSMFNRDYLYQFAGRLKVESTLGVKECYQDDKLIYSRDDFDRLLAEYDAQNQLSGVEESLVDMDNDEEVYYDLMGRRISEPQPGKIYVTPHGKRLVR